MRAGYLQLFAGGGEVAGIGLEEDRGIAGGAARGGEADDAAARARAVKAGIGAAIDLGALHGRGRERTKVEAVAQIACINAVEENLVGVRVAAANKQRGLRAELAFLHHGRSRHQPQSAGQVVAQRQIKRAEDAGGLAGLRLRRGGSGGRDHDGLAHPLGFKHDVAFHRVETAGVEAGRLQLTKAGRVDDQKEAALDAGENLKAAVGGGDGGADSFAAAD